MLNQSDLNNDPTPGVGSLLHRYSELVARGRYCSGSKNGRRLQPLTELILYQLLTSPVVFSECKLILYSVQYGILALDLRVSAYGEVGHVPSVGDNKGKMHINTRTRGPISDSNLDLTGWPPRDLSIWQHGKEAINI